MLYHIVNSEVWAAAEDPYRPPELSRDGFVRCFYSWQVERMAKERVSDSGGLLALELDYRAFPSPGVKSENPADEGEDVPQLSTPIARSAIRRVHELRSEGNREVRFEPAHPLFDRLSPDFRIRRARGSNEVRTLALFRCAMFAEMHPEELSGIDMAGFLAQTEDYYRRHASDERHARFVLCAGREIVGGATLIVEEKPPRPGRSPNLGGYVRDVYVLPDHRGQGGARLIMTMIREEAARRELGELALHASEMGRALYGSMGYRPNSAYLALEDLDVELAVRAADRSQ